MIATSRKYRFPVTVTRQLEFSRLQSQGARGHAPHRGPVVRGVSSGPDALPTDTAMVAGARGHAGARGGARGRSTEGARGQEHVDTHRGEEHVDTHRRGPVVHAGFIWPRRIADGYRDGRRSSRSTWTRAGARGQGARGHAPRGARGHRTAPRPVVHAGFIWCQRALKTREHKTREQGAQNQGARGTRTAWEHVDTHRGPVVHAGLIWPRRIADGYRDGG